MVDKIIQLDKTIFMLLNSMHNAFFDTIMYWLSDKYIWVPFYVILAFIIIKEFKKLFIIYFIEVTFLITCTDRTASGFFKPFFKRLRPSHEPDLENLIHLSEAGIGGQYGFISSHASNVFGLTTFLLLVLPEKYRTIKYILVIWAFLVSYSRIYNGVHYPLDIIFGAFCGIFYGFLFYYLNVFINKKFIQPS